MVLAAYYCEKIPEEVNLIKKMVTQAQLYRLQARMPCPRCSGSVVVWCIKMMSMCVCSVCVPLHMWKPGKITNVLFCYPLPIPLRHVLSVNMSLLFSWLSWKPDNLVITVCCQ